MDNLPGIPLLDTIAYLQAEARQLVAQRQPLPDDAEAVRERCVRFRDVLAQLLGPAPLQPAELDPQVVSCEELEDRIMVEKVYFTSSAGGRIPAMVVRPAEPEGRRPAVVVVHGWGQNRFSILPYRIVLARAGYVTMQIDNPFAGEHQTRAADANEYQYASLPLATCLGWSMMGMGVWDIRRAADYLQTRGDVDPDRIAVSGLCWGAMQTWVAAALDERFKVVIPVCGTSTYEALVLEYATYARHTCLGTYIPGILRHGDFQDIAACCAPRPVLVMNNVNDDWFPISGFTKLTAEMRAVYRAFGAPERFRAVLRDTVHDVTPEFAAQAIEWLGRYL